MRIGWPKSITFVRHGESEGNVISADDRSTTHKANHQFDLTERGRQQAREIGLYMSLQRSSHDTFKAFYVSTYARTHQTMRDMGYPNLLVEDARLDEWWKGVWYEMPHSDVDRLFPHERTIRDRAGRYHYRPLGGESGSDVECRIRSFLTDLRLNHEGEHVLVAAHGRWLQFLHKIINRFPHSQLDTKQKIPNCSMTVVKANGIYPRFAEFAYVPDTLVKSRPDLFT